MPVIATLAKPYSRKRKTGVASKIRKIPKSSKIINEAIPSTSRKFTENRFDVLSDLSDMDEDEDETNGNTNSAENSNKKPPPIIVTDTGISSNSITLTLNSLNIKDFMIKRMSIGIKIVLSRSSDFETFVEHLKVQKSEFYTHRCKSEKVFKVVLSGLDKCDTNEIISGLKDFDIQPKRIFEMKSKNTNSTRALYLCHFKRSEITFRQLEEIRAINHTIIKWVRYQPKFKQITQCNKCWMFGHGSDHCNRTSVCNFCASSSHESSECNLKTIEYTLENLSQFKCFNCTRKNLSNTHKANDPSCPCRQEYLDIRSKLTSSPNTRERNIPLSNGNQFPELPGFDEFHNTMKGIRAANHSTISQAISHRFNKQTPSTSKEKPSWSQIASSPSNNSSENNKFSIQECFNIFHKAIADMEKCQNKVDQMKVIASLVQLAFE